jgi:hypothetical protein
MQTVFGTGDQRMLKIISVAATVVLIAILYSGLEGQSQEPPRQDSQSAQQPTDTQQRGTEQSPLIVKAAPKSQAEVAADAKEREEKAQLDRQLVKYTFYLAIIALLQFFALIAQAVFVAWTIVHGRRVERAYVSGGGSFLGRVGRNVETGEDIIEMTDIFQVTVDNYGKTPARIISIEVGFCKSNNIPPEPRFTLNEFFNGVIPPNERGAATPVRLHASQISGDVIFGRFNYETVFKRPWRRDRTHHGGFALQVVDRSVRPINVPRVYWDWN